MLETRVNKSFVDPIMEDVRKEKERVRETTVYKDPIEKLKDQMLEAKIEAT